MKHPDGFCSYCGSTLDSNSRYCPSCGKDILQDKNDSGDTNPQPYDAVGTGPQVQDTGKIGPQMYATRNPISLQRGIMIKPKRILQIMAALAVIIVLLSVGEAILLRSTSPNSNPGNVQVTATPTSQPTATDTPTPLATDTSTALATATPTPQPTAANAPKAGTILYQEPGTDNWQGWTGSPDWKTLNSQLLNGGTNTDQISSTGQTNPKIILAPYTVTGTANYAVEAQIKVQRDNIDTGSSYSDCGFGIIVRIDSTSSQQTGYIAWIKDQGGNYLPRVHTANIEQASDGTQLAQATFDPGTNVHTYRVEVNGNDIKLLIDGAQKLHIQDNQFITGGNIGFLSIGTQISITSLKVTAL